MCLATMRYAVTGLLLVLPLKISAWWPTTLGDNLPVAANPDYSERWPSALPYSDARTLVVFLHGEVPYSNRYQIINRYGNLVFAEALKLAPLQADNWIYAAQAIPDGSGGAFAMWDIDYGPNTGIYAQRLDSLGNRLWGEGGLQLSNWASPLTDYDICPDALGGLLVACHYAFPTNGIWAQRIDGQGQPLWGDSGRVVIPATPWGEGFPQITYDGMGGLYMVWLDGRPPYYGALYTQRFNAHGNPVWQPSGILVYPGYPWTWEVISDGNGGFILHCGTATFNHAYRVDPQGQVLWHGYPVSCWDWARITPGEGGFFYLGFNGYLGGYAVGAYAQRMDLRGNGYWPIFGSLHGAPVITEPHLDDPFFKSLVYQGLHLYSVLYQGSSGAVLLRAQKMDSLANRIWGDAGAAVSLIEPLNYTGFSSCAPADDGGLVVVFQVDSWPYALDYDIYAKRCNADGSLGGPLPPVYSHPGQPGLSSSGMQVRFALPEAAEIQLELFDIMGRKVTTLKKGYYPAGDYAVRFDDTVLPSGVYVAYLKTPSSQQALKVVITR